MARTKNPTESLDDIKLMDLSPESVQALELATFAGNQSRAGRLGEFLIEAGRLVSLSLIYIWIDEGAKTPTDILKKMRQEIIKRQEQLATAARRKRHGGNIAEVLPDNEKDDIPF